MVRATVSKTVNVSSNLTIPAKILKNIFQKFIDKT